MFKTFCGEAIKSTKEQKNLQLCLFLNPKMKTKRVESMKRFPYIFLIILDIIDGDSVSFPEYSKKFSNFLKNDTRNSKPENTLYDIFFPNFTINLVKWRLIASRWSPNLLNAIL